VSSRLATVRPLAALGGWHQRRDRRPPLRFGQIAGLMPDISSQAWRFSFVHIARAASRFRVAGNESLPIPRIRQPSERTARSQTSSPHVYIDVTA
jgi:hypothetical protein